jgi:hypothetical protein
MNLLLAAVLLMQDKAAEDVFGKITASIEKAKTVQVKLAVKIGDLAEGSTEEGTVTLLIGDRNRFRVSTKEKYQNKGDLQAKEIEGEYGCDGASLWSSAGRRVEAAPPLLDAWYRTAISRIGYSQAYLLKLRFGLSEQAKDRFPDLEKMLEIDDIKSGPDESGAKTLTYTVAVKSLRSADTYIDRYKIKIWYDAKSLKMIKRTVKSRDESSSESYESFVFDADIPDEKFKLPEEKK